MKLTLTLDEIKNHYREMFNLDKSDEIEIENLSTKIEIEVKVQDTDSVMSEINNIITRLVTVHKRRFLAITLVRELTGWNLKKSIGHVDMCCNLHDTDLQISLEDASRTILNLRGLFKV